MKAVLEYIIMIYKLNKQSTYDNKKEEVIIIIIIDLLINIEE